MLALSTRLARNAFVASDYAALTFHSERFSDESIYPKISATCIMLNIFQRALAASAMVGPLHSNARGARAACEQRGYGGVAGCVRRGTGDGLSEP